MIQIVFNDISAAELSHLPTQVQFHLLEALNIQPADIDETILAKRYGVLERGELALDGVAAASARGVFDTFAGTLAVGIAAVRAGAAAVGSMVSASTSATASVSSAQVPPSSDRTFPELPSPRSSDTSAR